MPQFWAATLKGCLELVTPNMYKSLNEPNGPNISRLLIQSINNLDRDHRSKHVKTIDCQTHSWLPSFQVFIKKNLHSTTSWFWYIFIIPVLFLTKHPTHHSKKPCWGTRILGSCDFPRQLQLCQLQPGPADQLCCDRVVQNGDTRQARQVRQVLEVPTAAAPEILDHLVGHQLLSPAAGKVCSWPGEGVQGRDDATQHLLQIPSDQKKGRVNVAYANMFWPTAWAKTCGWPIFRPTCQERL